MEEPKKEEPNLVERAEKAAKELQEQLKKVDEIMTRQALAGKSMAGEQAPPPRDKEKEKIDKINAWLKSTGMHI